MAFLRFSKQHCRCQDVKRIQIHLRFTLGSWAGVKMLTKHQEAPGKRSEEAFEDKYVRLGQSHIQRFHLIIPEPCVLGCA